MRDDPSDSLFDDERDDAVAGGQRMWPLDLTLAVLAGVVLTIIFSQLRIDDPRWLYNATTYAVIIPLVALVLAFLLRNLVSQNVQKSVQIGFLTSVIVHLTLLLVAVRWVIFPAYFPDAFMGVKSERAPVRKTVPEYVFEAPRQSEVTPDWSRPVDVETASRVVPEQQRQLPPMDQTMPKMEMPSRDRPRESQEPPTLTRRELPTSSEPSPADSPAKLARRLSPSMNRSDLRQPTAPDVQPDADSPADAVARERAESALTSPSKSSVVDRASPSASLAALADVSPRPTQLDPRPMAAPQLSRPRTMALPDVRAESTMAPRDRRRPKSGPVGVSPSAPAVAVARDREVDSRRLSDRSFTMETAEIETRNPITSTLKQIGEASPETSSRLTDIVDAKLFRRTTPASMPNMSTPDINVDPTSGRRPSVASRTRLRRGGINPLGADVQIPDLGAGQSARANRGSAERDLASSESSRASDAMGSDSRSELSRRRSSESEFPETAVPEPASMALDLLAPLGRVGLSRRDAEQAGVVPDAQRPDIASMDISRNRRPKRDSGSPITPAGSQVSSVESFNRRTLRTQGGAAATPAGMVGPATEEAIERGLAYLADRQNEDGSWSLHGQGEPVMLRSDSAATGLCLLAFQGAGYTHKKHQYANVVAKGLNFLRTIQLTNGDLCKRQDALANNNVAFYSHGIAALAMSEAYGMTQDEELREPAQLALDYIAATQHRRRGGWRYTPQVSADTSVTGWMMMALKSGELSGLKVDPETYVGIERWLDFARESAARQDRYRYDPFAPDTDAQRHGRFVSPTMTSVGMLMRMYLGWKRDRQEMQSAADYLLNYPPEIGTPESPQRDTYYWYYATQVMFHMGGDYWKAWNKDLNPVLLEGQIKRGVEAGSWDPAFPVKDRWGPHAGRLYVTTMNLLNLEVYYRHLPIYEDTAD